MVPDACVDMLRNALPELQAVYLFGSQASGQATVDSDVDLAVLLPTEEPADRLWALSSQLAERLQREVDLIDLRSASTVMRYQIVQQGQRLWGRDSDVDEFELATLSEYWDLQITRRAIVADIKQRGSIHGR